MTRLNIRQSIFIVKTMTNEFKKRNMEKFQGEICLWSQCEDKWCKIQESQTSEPHISEHPETGSSPTVTEERYTEMLKETFPEDSEDIYSRTIFMQDGAPAHTSRIAMDWLEVTFPWRLISNKSDFMSPPPSTDLNPLDMFLWGCIKEEIHRAQPGSTAEVKQLIREFLSSISEDLMQRVTRQFISQVRRCIEARGRFSGRCVKT